MYFMTIIIMYVVNFVFVNVKYIIIENNNNLLGESSGFREHVFVLVNNLIFT